MPFIPSPPINPELPSATASPSSLPVANSTIATTAAQVSTGAHYNPQEANSNMVTTIVLICSLGITVLFVVCCSVRSLSLIRSLYLRLSPSAAAAEREHQHTEAATVGTSNNALLGTLYAPGQKAIRPSCASPIPHPLKKTWKTLDGGHEVDPIWQETRATDIVDEGKLAKLIPSQQERKGYIKALCFERMCLPMPQTKFDEHHEVVPVTGVDLLPPPPAYPKKEVHGNASRFSWYHHHNHSCSNSAIDENDENDGSSDTWHHFNIHNHTDHTAAATATATAATAATAATEQPEVVETPGLMASEQALMVQEGIRAWSFVPPPLSGIEVASGSEIEFNPRVRPPCTDEDKEHYMPPINVVSRLPLPLADRNVVYFEVKVMSLPSPTASTVAIGLVSRPYPEWRHVGFNRYSVGIHNNGTIFRNSQTIPATTTLLSFSEGDIIGCGFRAKSGKVFFTVNGALAGTVQLCPIHRKYRPFPAVSFTGDVGCSLAVNFGQEAFICRAAQLRKWGLLGRCRRDEEPLPLYQPPEQASDDVRIPINEDEQQPQPPSQPQSQPQLQHHENEDEAAADAISPTATSAT